LNLNNHSRHTYRRLIAFRRAEAKVVSPYPAQILHLLRLSEQVQKKHEGMRVVIKQGRRQKPNFSSAQSGEKLLASLAGEIVKLGGDGQTVLSSQAK